MQRLVILNNYSFEDVGEEVRRGEKPDHHLYGINHLQDMGYEVEIVPLRTSKLLQALNTICQNKRFPISLGDLDQQWSALLRLRPGDIIYSPCQSQTALLSYLRALRLFPYPIINLAHHPLTEGKLRHIRRPFNRLFVRGSDALPALSELVSRQINSNSLWGKRSIPLHWGPDAAYYAKYRSEPSDAGRGVIAAGRTGRDFEVFGKAASLTSAEAHIICLQENVHPSFSEFGSNVHVRIEPNTGYLNYIGLLKIFSQMRALAVPLVSQENLSGLTGLTDALGLGKPIIMTRHPMIDIDIEAEGIGLWVEPGDVEGWRKAIEFFEDNEQEALAMGKRARALVEEKWNSMTFSQEIDDIIKEVKRRNRLD